MVSGKYAECDDGGDNQEHRDLLVSRFSHTVDLRILDGYERRLVEVATFVGFRIDEEALGATFHLVVLVPFGG